MKRIIVILFLSTHFIFKNDSLTEKFFSASVFKNNSETFWDTVPVTFCATTNAFRT